MKFHKNKLLTTVAAAAIALAVGACSSSSDDDDVAVTDPTPVVAPEGPTDEQVAVVNTALEAVSAAMMVYSGANTAFDADMTVDTATAVKAAAEALHAAATAAQTAIDAGATSAQVEALGNTVAHSATLVAAADTALTIAVAHAATAAEEAKAAAELAKAQTDAATAATAADTAATDARAAAGDAEAARQNRAAIQTGDFHTGNSGELAYAAEKQAKAAEAAAVAANTASDASAAATDATTATRHLVAAEAAQKAAEDALAMAVTNSEAAVAAATKEVKVVDKTKSVGGTSITFDDTTSSSTVNKVMRHTGLLTGVDIASPGKRDIHGRLLTDEAGEPNAFATLLGAQKPKVSVTYDSADDSARVTLIHSYLGSQKQKQFVRFGGETPFITDEGGRVLPVPTETNFDVVDGKIDDDKDENQGATTPTPRVAPKVAGGDFRAVDATTTAVTLYYVPARLVDDTVGEDDDGIDQTKDNTVGKTDDGIDQTKVFLERNIANGETTYRLVNVVEVTVDNATSFKHLHYGLWNGLSGSGANTVTDLGTGFVNTLSSMTDPDSEAEGGMPNFGGATYNGNWVANVQEADEEGDGGITRADGTSTLTADFVKHTVGVTLSNLATLKGAISGNTFSGDAAPVMMDTLPGGLANAEFMGEFKGAFFGASAAEAGGVFDYASKDNKDGAFRGSFGGAR